MQKVVILFMLQFQSLVSESSSHDTDLYQIGAAFAQYL